MIQWISTLALCLPLIAASGTCDFFQDLIDAAPSERNLLIGEASESDFDSLTLACESGRMVGPIMKSVMSAVSNSRVLQTYSPEASSLTMALFRRAKVQRFEDSAWDFEFQVLPMVTRHLGEAETSARDALCSEIFSIDRSQLHRFKQYCPDSLLTAVLESAVKRQDVDLYQRALAHGATLTNLNNNFKNRHREFLDTQIPDCAICMDPQTSQTAVTVCRNGHQFHLECMSDSLRSLRRGSPLLCPNCRGSAFADLNAIHLAAINGSLEDLNALRLAVAYAVSQENMAMITQLASLLVSSISRISGKVYAADMFELLLSCAASLASRPEAVSRLFLKAVWEVVTSGSDGQAVIIPRLAAFIEAGQVDVRVRDDLALLAAVVYGKREFAEFLVSRGSRLFTPFNALVSRKVREYFETSEMLEYVIKHQPHARTLFSFSAVQRLIVQAARQGDLRFLHVAEEEGMLEGVDFSGIFSENVTQFLRERNIGAGTVYTENEMRDRLTAARRQRGDSGYFVLVRRLRGDMIALGQGDSITSTAAVETLKRKAGLTGGVIWAGKTLQDGRSLEVYGITKGATLVEYLPFRGGQPKLYGELTN